MKCELRSSLLCTAFLLILLFSGAGPALRAIGPVLGEGPIGNGAPSRGETTPADIWPMYMGNTNHTGRSWSMIPKSNGTTPLWTASIPSLLSTNSPVLYEGVVYTGSGDGSVRGFDMLTGEKVWEVKALNNFIRSSVTIQDGVLYFGARGGHLFGYRLSDKAKVLDLPLNASDFESSPVIGDGRLYIGSISSDLKGSSFYAVDLSLESVSWSFQMDPATENLYGFGSTAAYHDGRVYVTEGAGNLYCLDSNGFDDGNDGSYTSEPNTGPNDADMLWTFNNPYSLIGDPMLAEGKVYFGTENGRVYCLDALTGAHVWNRTVGKGQRSIQTSPAYHDGTVYITCRNSQGPFEGGSALAMDSGSGSVIWRFNISQPVTESSPVLAENALIFAARDSKVYCISTSPENIADEDRVFWSFNSGSPITSTAAIGSGLVYLAKDDPSGSAGKLYAFGAPDPSVTSLSISDGNPFTGERISLTAKLENNATIPAEVSLEFKASNANNSNQRVLGSFGGIGLEAFGTTTVICNWTAIKGFDYIVAMIKESRPKDKDPYNNFQTIDVTVTDTLTGYWTSSGGGPARTGGAGERLQSNRTYWSMQLGATWTGPPEPMWYDDFQGNGTVAATGPNFFLTGPAGEMLAFNTTTDPYGGPGPYWSYDGGAVDMIGRPVVLADSIQSRNGPNRVFSYGSDGAVWAFDWSGFWDGRNDGPFTSEIATGIHDGDVVWRTAIPIGPSQPMFSTGGSVFIMTGDGMLRSLDDDDGAISWSVGPFSPGSPICGSGTAIFISAGVQLFVIDASTSSVLTVMDLSPLIGVEEVRSISARGDALLLTHGSFLSMIDATPDDNMDGTVNSADADDGQEDNLTGMDLLWSTDLLLPVATPPAFSQDDGRIGTATADSVIFLYPGNGTVSNRVALTGACTGRIVAAGDSFYILTGSDPWTIQAFSPNDLGNPAQTWTLELEHGLRGEMVIAGDNMIISTSSGEVRSIGSLNSPPDAVISSPGPGLLIFPGEPIVLDASLSSDLDGDELIYSWSLDGTLQPILETDSPTGTIELRTLGKVTLVLRVYDTMRAYGEARVNITVLKRVTYPDFTDYFYDINVHMSYGISEVSGWGLVSFSVPEDPPDVEGAIFICRLEFQPWPSYADHKFEWANVTIGFSDKEFPVRMEIGRVRLFRMAEGGRSWEMAPISGTDNRSQVVYGNFSDLDTGLYAIGILNNAIPQLKHAETPQYRVKQTEPAGWKLRVEYRDLDNERPEYIRLVMDNTTLYDLQSEDISPVVTRFTPYGIEGIELTPGRHHYYFETSDGNFINSTKVYSLTVENSPPIPSIEGPTQSVFVGEPVLFDGSDSSDPDNDQLSFSWDFNDLDGIQKEAVDKKVDHIYYEEGIYVVTLTVSDRTDQRSTTITVSVIDEMNGRGEPEDKIPEFVLYILIAILTVLIIAVIAFLVLSRKKEALLDEGKYTFESDWNCPECGNKVPGGARDCSECGYEYDPLDFEE